MTNKGVRWAFNFSKWNPTESELLLATACIQPEEKARLAKFVFKKDFKSSLIGRLMMRKFVHESSTDTANKPRSKYNEIEFIRDAKGKPLLADNKSKLSYNVSHDGSFTVLAGEQNDLLLGIDVMNLDRSVGKSLSEYFRIMSKQFSVNEWQTIRRGVGDRNQLAMFTRHWCLKESYVKAIGVGINVDLKEISFHVDGGCSLQKDSIIDTTELYVGGVKQLNWQFHEMMLDDNHCVAVALNSNNKIDFSNQMVFRELNFNELMVNAVPLLDNDEEYCRSYFRKIDQ